MNIRDTNINNNNCHSHNDKLECEMDFFVLPKLENAYYLGSYQIMPICNFIRKIIQYSVLLDSKGGDD